MSGSIAPREPKETSSSEGIVKCMRELEQISGVVSGENSLINLNNNQVLTIIKKNTTNSQLTAIKRKDYFVRSLDGNGAEYCVGGHLQTPPRGEDEEREYEASTAHILKNLRAILQVWKKSAYKQK